jgi:hypothetical protein
MGTRNTKADVERILASINEAAEDLGLRGAGNWAVETKGGSYLYLTDRSGKAGPGAGAHGYPPAGTGPGETIEELGNGWHSAYERLFTLRRDLLTVQLRQGEQ